MAFLRGLLLRLRGRVIVVWNGGGNPKGPAIRELLQRFPRLHLERLPGYAPDLNPVEMIWAYLKHGRLSNFVPRHVRHLDRVVVDHLAELRGDPALIRSLWAGLKLPFLDKNLPTGRSIATSPRSRVCGCMRPPDNARTQRLATRDTSRYNFP